MFNKRYEELSHITSIIDPDKFPIFSLIEVINERDIVSIWKYRPELMERVKKTLGWSLEVKPSQIAHHDAGDGVFLQTPLERITTGTLLGFAPGVIYDNIKDFEEVNTGHLVREFD